MVEKAAFKAEMDQGVKGVPDKEDSMAAGREAVKGYDGDAISDGEDGDGRCQ